MGFHGNMFQVHKSVAEILFCGRVVAQLYHCKVVSDFPERSFLSKKKIKKITRLKQKRNQIKKKKTPRETSLAKQEHIISNSRSVI